MRIEWVVALMLAAGDVAASPRGVRAPAEATQAQTAGAPSKAWDGKYKILSGGHGGALLCPGRDQVLTVSGGRLAVPLTAYNPAVVHLHSRGCDDRESKDPDCQKMFSAITAAGASLDQNVKLAELVVSIDKAGKVAGSVKRKALPLPGDADDDQRSTAGKLAELAVVDGRFGIDDHGRNAAGLGKGRVGSIKVSTTSGRDDMTCELEVQATDYKKSGYCAASGYACRADGDCCSHNCVPTTRSCR